MTRDKTIHVALSSDNNYTKQTSVVIVSALKNKARNDNLFFHILDGGIAKESKSKILSLQDDCCKIEFLNVDDSFFDNMPLGDAIPHITKATYYRYVLPKLLPKIDKVLYLDVDLLVLGSIAKLFQYDIDNYYFAGVKDILYKENTDRLNIGKYCNAGVLLLNLKKMREDDMQRKLFSYTAKNHSRIVYGDQDVINTVLQAHIKYLPDKYNVQVGPYEMSNKYNSLAKSSEAVIMHFIGAAKPWVPSSLNPFVEEYYHYLAISPFGNEHPQEYKRIKASNRHKKMISLFRKITPKPIKKVARKVASIIFQK